jgi:hypothetical protein
MDARARVEGRRIQVRTVVYVYGVVVELVRSRLGAPNFGLGLAAGETTGENVTDCGRESEALSN